MSDIHILKITEYQQGAPLDHRQALCGVRCENESVKENFTHLDQEENSAPTWSEAYGAPTCEACILLHWADPSKTYTIIKWWTPSAEGMWF